MKKLPVNWTVAPIKAVTIDCKQHVPAPNESFRYIDIASIDRDTKTITNSKQLLGKNAPSRARKKVYAGDVLVSMTRPNLNGVTLVPSDLDGQIASTGFDVLRAPKLDPRWLFYIVRTRAFVDRMSELVQGALYPAIRSKDVRDFVIPIAPKNEQKRITDKLDTLITRVSNCRARLDIIPSMLKQFRQAVLASASSGDLTQSWGEDKSSDSWEYISLQDLIVDGPKNGLYKSSSSYGQGTRIVRIDNFYDGEITSWEELKRLNVTKEEAEDYGLEVNDIIINRVNSLPYLGKSALIRELPEPCVFESNMMRIRLDTTQVLPEYCILMLNSPEGTRQLRQNAKHAVNQASINQSDVRSVTIPIPTLDEQKEIVRRVESLFAFSTSIEARYKNTRNQIDNLTSGILEKAFCGELVSQDPQDESAVSLLEVMNELQNKPIDKSAILESNSKVKTTKPSKISVTEYITQLSEDSFTFDQLRSHVNADYELLKEIIFKLLTESQPIIKQTFDIETKTMKFVRIKI